MVKALLLLVSTLLVSCMPEHDLTPIEGQAEMSTIVWYDVFGETDTPPSIDWRTEAELDCGNGNAFLFEGTGPKFCYSGLTLPGWDFAIVARPDDVPVSRTTFAHELLHIRKVRHREDYDWRHESPDFKTGGLLEQANAAMERAGF